MAELVEPAFLWVPESAAGSAAEEAADFAAEIGMELDAEQRLALDAILAERPDGRWAAFEAALIAARQNLKTFVFEVVALADIYLDFGSDLVVWTAHEFNTAMESFRDVEGVLESRSYLSRRVSKVIKANGEEGFEFVDGKRLRFKARTKTGGRGLTGDRVFLDEGFALQPSHMGSLMPTMSAKSMHGNPQICYGSSAGRVESEVLRNLRDRGRGGGDPSLVYVEWADPDKNGCASSECDHRYGADGCALDDQRRWQAANPALGRRISVEWVESERRSMPPDEFARERLGWWDEPPVGEVRVPEDAWQGCANRDAELREPVGLGVDVSPGHASAAIVAFGGALHVSDHHQGASWLPRRLSQVVEAHEVTAVALDPAGPAGALLPDLEREGFKVRSNAEPDGLLVLLDSREQVQACEGFLAEVTDGTLVHRDEHSLNAAVEGASRRAVGDSWKWSRRDSRSDICPLVAATAARFVGIQPEREEEDNELVGQVVF